MDAPPPPKIFLTGVPGCGKTTLIKAVTDRFPRLVTGFDLVSHKGDRAVFARKGGRSGHRVGKYSVFLEPLEGWALELITPSSDRPLVVLDEVGKMECLSRVFQLRVLELVDSPYPILGTVALRGEGLIRRIHEHAGVECREVRAENRTRLCQQLQEVYEEYLRAAFDQDDPLP